MDLLTKAKEVVKRLSSHGHTAYFAGGWVRDHVMGRDSSDIDIATSATPEEIVALFPKTLQVGLSFGVVVVVWGGHQFEVATFRRDIDCVDGRKPASVEYCEPREDALRRDFTINGLFYDPLEHKVYDYVEGVRDIKGGIIRTIGSPYERFVEDRLRMVRAFRFASRFGFHIDLETQEAIRQNADTLFPSVSRERIWQEFCKMASSPAIDTAFIDMHRLELLPEIFPSLKGVHLNAIKQRVLHFPNFPKGCPAAIYLAQLFPEATLEEMKETIASLRASNRELEVVETYYLAKGLVEKERIDPLHYDSFEWVRFLTRHFAKRSLEVAISPYSGEERRLLMELHEKRLEELGCHIARATHRKPLVTGRLLMKMGIKPGTKMGELIDEAEKIAVKYDLHDVDRVLDKLKESSLWKELLL